MTFAKGIRQEFKVTKAIKSDTRGTTIEFLPDATIFMEDGIELKSDRIKQRLEEFSYLCTGLNLTLDYKNEDQATYKSEDGLSDYMVDLVGDKIKLTDTFRVRAEEGRYNVDIALCYTEGYQEINKLYTNNIPNSGGTHLTGYRSAMTRTINDIARAEGLLKKQDKNLTGEDLREGLVLILSLNMSDPVFSGQTKDVLTSAQGRTVVERILAPEIEQWFNTNPNDLKAIVEKALTTRRARVAAQRAREATRGNGKTKLKSTLQGKLADCSTNDPAEAELFLVEGE